MVGEVRRQGGERSRTGGQAQPDEADDQEHEADVHHDEVGQGCPAHLAPLGVEEDQEERRHGHQLPEKEERITSVGNDDAQHRERHDGKCDVMQREVGRRLAFEGVAQVAAGIERRGGGADGDQQHEKGRKRIQRPAVAAQGETPGGPQSDGAAAGQCLDGFYRERRACTDDERQGAPGLGLRRRDADGGGNDRQSEQGVEEKHRMKLNVTIERKPGRGAPSEHRKRLWGAGERGFIRCCRLWPTP